MSHTYLYSPVAEHHGPLACTHGNFPHKDSQAELTWVGWCGWLVSWRYISHTKSWTQTWAPITYVQCCQVSTSVVLCGHVSQIKLVKEESLKSFFLNLPSLFLYQKTVLTGQYIGYCTYNWELTVSTHGHCTISCNNSWKLFTHRTSLVVNDLAY